MYRDKRKIKKRKKLKDVVEDVTPARDPADVCHIKGEIRARYGLSIDQGASVNAKWAYATEHLNSEHALPAKYDCWRNEDDVYTFKGKFTDDPVLYGSGVTPPDEFTLRTDLHNFVCGEGHCDFYGRFRLSGEAPPRRIILGKPFLCALRFSSSSSSSSLHTDCQLLGPYIVDGYLHVNEDRRRATFALRKRDPSKVVYEITHPMVFESDDDEDDEPACDCEGDCCCKKRPRDDEYDSDANDGDDEDDNDEPENGIDHEPENGIDVEEDSEDDD